MARTLPGGGGALSVKRKRRWAAGVLAGLAIASTVAVSYPATPRAPRAASDPGTKPAAEKPAEVQRAERRVERDSSDWIGWARLGTEYVTAAKVASEPAFYGDAERALARSAALNPAEDNWQVLAGKAYLAAGRHDFGKALSFAEPALRISPGNSFLQGVLVDSLTELGRYPEAVAAMQQMVDRKPNFASFSRVSYQRELHGDVDGAIEAFELARQAAANVQDRAFAELHLGELEYNRGALEAAEEHYRTVLELEPSAPPALAGLGKVAAARGDRKGAIARLKEATGVFADPELLKDLGDLLFVAGQHREAARQYARMDRSNSAQAANGVDVDLEVALSTADRRVDLDEGLAAARREWEKRKSVHVADALGWQLFVHGRYDEAIVLADHALHLGTPSAPMHLHRAKILEALGRREEAQAAYRSALAINPGALIRGVKLSDLISP